MRASVVRARREPLYEEKSPAVRYEQKKIYTSPRLFFYPRASRFMIPDIFCTLRRKEIVDKPWRRFMQLRTMRRKILEKDIARARLVN